MNNVLITGAAGFIGFHLSKRLLDNGVDVTGIDNLNPYYEVSLKEARLRQLLKSKKFTFVKIDLENRDEVEGIFKKYKFDAVIHLAAQAGVRYSLENPHCYVHSNIVGFLHILEGCRHTGVNHLVFASSSSVYGANKRIPFSVHQNVDHPVSLYAATKKASELMAHTYASLYKIPSTGLRFFTVYGPWGRPDMALFKFTKKIIGKEPIDVFNFGKMKRDFTYIDDIIEGIIKVISKVPEGDPSWDGSNPVLGISYAPYKIYNIGNNKPVDLLIFISVLEEELGIKAEKNLLPLQPGDVIETYADITDLMKDTGFRPATDIHEGIKRFVRWYREYYNM